MADEGSRKKRGADNQLTQDNWEKEEDGDDDAEQSGPFKKASDQELAKRKIVKARRGTSGELCEPKSAGGPVVAPESKPAPAPAPAAGGFSWTKPVAAAGEGAAKEGEETKEGEEKKGDGAESEKKEEEKKDDAKKNESPAKKPAFPAFGGFGSGGTLGSSATTPFTFASFAPGNAKPFGSATGFTFGSSAKAATSTPYSFNSGKAVGFGDVSSAGWAPKKKDDDEGGEGEGGGDDEDAEKEVQIKKSDAVVQLEEVETCTGEEDETCAFQVRAKLFVLGSPEEDKKEGDDDKKESVSPAKKPEANGDKKEVGGDNKGVDAQWVVVGIGNLKVNVPRDVDETDKSRRPRVIMRRQKTLQLCLNSYLFANMICDRAGPKDVRFTGMKNSEEGDKKDKDKEAQKDGLLATYLVRVKEEDQAQELIAAINKHKNG